MLVDSVRSFAVDGVIPDHENSVGESERYAENVFDEEEDE